MPQPPFRTLVTGASSGIGAEYARALRARGEAIVLVARRADRLSALATALGGEPAAIPIAEDLAHEGAAPRLQARLDERGLTIDGLVNCAGLGRTGAFVGQPEQALRAMCDLNVRALVELTRRFLPPMVARGRGRIVNVASNAAFQPIPYLGVYAATKSFVLSFTEALAEELKGTGVVVQALCPGLTETEFLDVSQTHGGLAVRRLPTMTPKQVVAASLAGLDRRKLRVVVGLPNRILGFVTQRLAPGWVARRVAGELYREHKRDVTPQGRA